MTTLKTWNDICTDNSPPPPPPFFFFQPLYWDWDTYLQVYVCAIKTQLEPYVATICIPSRPSKQNAYFHCQILINRNFSVRIGGTLSEIYDQEQGVPQHAQCSILAVTLFNIKINSLVKCLGNGIDCSLYVDDFLICYQSKHMNTIERYLQLCLHKIQKWADENGFKFSQTKTVCMHFCNLRKLHPEPTLILNGFPANNSTLRPRWDHVTATLLPRYFSTWIPRKSVMVFHVVSTLKFHVEKITFCNIHTTFTFLFSL